jgi:hypothetical protein
MNAYFVRLLLVGSLAFGLSSVIHAKDVPATLYDKSEDLPYESTLVFEVEKPQEGTWRAQESDSSVESSSLTRPDEIPVEQAERPVQSSSNSLTILDHCLRC